MPNYNLLFYSILIVYCLIGMAWGLWRGLMKSRIRGITILASAVLAVVATLVLKSKLATINVQELLNLIATNTGADMSTVNEFLTISPSLGNILLSSAGSILAPLLMLVIFLVLWALTGIAYFIVSLCLRRSFKQLNAESKFRKTRTMVLSVVQCLIVIAVFMVPIASYAELVQPVAAELTQGDILDAETKQIVSDLNDNNIKPINESSPVKVFRALGGRALCHSMTDFEVNGIKVHLEEEIGSLASFASKIVSLSSTKIENYGPQQADVIDSLADSFEGSALLPTIAGEVIHSATGAWIRGEKFLGTDCPDLGDAIDPVFVRLLTIVHGDALNTVYLKEDIHTVADFIGVLAAHEIFSSLSDTDQLLTTLGSDGVVKELVTHLGTNERMKTLIPEITNMGMRAIATTLGIPDSVENVYDNFLGDVADVLNSTQNLPTAERIEAISEELESAFDNAGVAIDSEIIVGYTNALLNDLGGETTVTPEYISDFFTMYAIATADDAQDDPDTVALSIPLTGEDYGFTCPAYVGKSIDVLLTTTGASTLAKVCKQLVEIEETDPEAFAVAASAVFEAEFTALMETTGNVEAEVIMVSIRTITVTAPVSSSVVENTAALQSAQEMKTTVVTLQDLLVDPDEAAANITVETLTAEADAIGAIFDSAISLKDTVGSGEINDLTQVAGAVGGILDSLSGSSSFGSDKTATLFTAVMQSETVRETADLKLSEATTLAGKATEGDPDYTKTMNAVATGVNIANSIGKDEMASEEEIRELLNNMTPQTAAMLQTYVTPERMTGYGVPEQNSAVSAELLGNMFEYMSHDLPDYEAEAKAISHMLNIATAASESSEEKLFGGKLPEATELVDIIMASDAVCNSLTTTLTDGTAVTRFDPFGVAEQIPEGSEDEAEVLDALYAYRAANPQSAQTDLRLQALAALFGARLSFN